MTLGWSKDGPDLVIPPTLGWSKDGPSDPPPEPVLGWIPEQQGHLDFAGEGTLEVSGHPILFVTGPQLAGGGTLTVDGYPRLFVPGGDLAGEGTLTAAARAKVYLTATADGEGNLTVTVTIPDRGPQDHSGTGPFSAPWWSRYAHITLLGGGASGQTGSGVLAQAGKGGNPGNWSSTTVDMGALHGPFSFTFTIGAGGAQAANSDNAAPNPGGNTAATWTGGGTHTATGGTGTVASGQNGGSPGNHTYQGNTYNGGPGGTGNAGTGGTPGGAGAGGNGGIFGSRTRGGPGAPGQAWLVFAQN